MQSFEYMRHVRWGVIGIAGCAAISAYVFSISHAPAEFELYVFNTPGNPSIFMRTPEDERILINGGSNSSIIRYLTSVLPFYSKRIDKVIALSSSTDDANGLVSVKERYQIGSFGLASSTELRFDVLSQGIFRIAYGRTSFMLLWHASKSVQNDLVRSMLSTSTAMNLASDVLIMDGSPLSAHVSSKFIEAVKPRYLVYSQKIVAGSRDKTHSSGSDPFYMILEDHRFNVQQKNAVKALSDGESVEIRANTRM